MLKLLMITPKKMRKIRFRSFFKENDKKKNKVGKSLKHEISYNISEISWFYN